MTMKKIAWTLGILLVIGAVAWMLMDEPLPEGGHQPEAERLTDRMFEAIGYEAWQAIPFVSWSFRGQHHFVWDKVEHVAQVKWDDMRVVIDLDTRNGRAYREGRLLEGSEAEEALEKAWGYFANDSFWLNAPAKARDSGTERSVVVTDDGDKRLKVHYSSGGVTPGDTYVWLLDENGLPTAVKMWVSIIPVGGTKATWEGWRDMRGAKIATEHRMGPASVDIGNLKVGDAPEDFGLTRADFRID